MTHDIIAVVPLNPALGAEVSGVDLSRPLGSQIFREIHDALMKHQVLFFRDQEMDHEQHKTLGRLFGELHIHPNRTEAGGSS